MSIFGRKKIESVARSIANHKFCDRLWFLFGNYAIKHTAKCKLFQWVMQKKRWPITQKKNPILSMSVIIFHKNRMRQQVSDIVCCSIKEPENNVYITVMLEAGISSTEETQTIIIMPNRETNFVSVSANVNDFRMDARVMGWGISKEERPVNGSDTSPSFRHRHC